MKRKTILSTIVSIMLCLSLISGATFALFTSESEVNIAVTAGKVQLTAAVDGDSLKTWSNEIEMANGAFALGGNAEIDGANLKINKMVPLDKVTFNIDIENKSTTTVQYRLLYQATGELMPALKVSATIGGEETVLLKNGKTTWEFLAAGEQLDPIVVTVYFPNGDDSTTDVNEDNQYKNKTAKHLF